ncbi:carboxymuconolactone decarboxylase family protein [Edwardsiella tarda]|uniref:carboxymuconolactone decarboxylase family protein n=1 Tax=Edwardsiella tarda TaxID=636 RepID=UPI0002E5E290|nr:carboxymuconolactone decarboxylase family protein [Edwardsiella tarda]
MMLTFEKYDETNAPPESRELLQQSKRNNGGLPALHAIMAESPQLLAGYQTLHHLFLHSSFDDEEKTVVWQTINVEHRCHYCVPAHTLIARAMKVDEAINDALRNETPLPNARLEALRTFTLAMVRQRGEVDEATLEAFLAAGFTRRHILDVILGLAQKVMSNYTNHVAHTELDARLQSVAWQKRTA